jgi:hypothetical protein
MARIVRWVAAASLALAGCSFDAQGSGNGGTDSDSETSSGSSTTSAGTTTTATTTGTGTGTTTTATTTTSATTDDSTTTTVDTTGSGSGTDTGGEVVGEYPECSEDEPECPEGFDLCVQLGGGEDPPGSHCTIYCGNDMECPAVDGADAIPTCGAPMSEMDRCSLDCNGGLSCPSGMQCLQLFTGVFRCGFPNDG